LRECGRLAEKLNDQHEDVEIERRHGGDDIRRPPPTLKLLPVSSSKTDGQHHEREGPHNVRRRDRRERKAEPSEAGEDRGGKE
jgi:hypothetical protein